MAEGIIGAFVGALFGAMFCHLLMVVVFSGSGED